MGHANDHLTSMSSNLHAEPPGQVDGRVQEGGKEVLDSLLSATLTSLSIDKNATSFSSEIDTVTSSCCGIGKLSFTEG